MICILHGYLLEGSGSNLWTRAIVESLCRQGETIHLMAQENHPDRYPFITEARRYGLDGSCETYFERESPYPGRCVLHKPDLGDMLPVYVWDRYEEFSRVVPMVELSEEEVEAYLDVNVRALLRIVAENGITVLHANHSVLISVAAERVSEVRGIPFAIFPHGSALEFAVKRDERFRRRAEQAFRKAGKVFVHGAEMRERVRDALPALPGLEEKFSDLHLGVDTRQFEPIPREARPANIERLTASLDGVPRGRTREQTDAMLARLHGGMTVAELGDAFAAIGEYDNKAPDADLEEKLAGVSWERDPTLLFVGRLISTKGIHGVVAALPLLLREHPDLRLLVVGHGPLREPLEALLWALERGDRAMVERIVKEGRALEGAPEGESDDHSLSQAALFLERLKERGELDDYYRAAREHVRADRVIFTGYLTHKELRFLFPCADVSVFPSVVKEAGPLVFLEALASGSYPLGTDFGGMKESIASIAEALPPGAAEVMKLDPDPAGTVEDIVRNVPAALARVDALRETLFEVARDRYDWTSVARQLHDELEAM